MSVGKVYLVGAGPGDPGLLTLRGKQLLERADVVVYDYLAGEGLLGFAPPQAKRIYVGKQAGDHTLTQDEINALLVELGLAGHRVVRLKGGDPYVFGRGGEEALALLEAGVPFEEVPGITSGIAAPAYAGIPVTHRLLASNFGVVTGHETPDKDDSDLDYKVLAGWRGTLAFYMGVRNLPPICHGLIAGGLEPATPAAVIHWGTTSRQRVVTSTVAGLPAAAEAAKIKPPAIILVGKVVALREKLNWFESRPLFGRRVVVTRARQQASDLTEQLTDLGAEVIELPTIRIEPPADPAPLQRAAAGVADFDWIVFTSVNAVDAFFAALRSAGLDSRALAKTKLCSIGPATSDRLAAFGLRPDAQPPKYTTDSIGEAIAGVSPLAGARILYPRSDIAPPKLAADLAARGATVVDAVAYRTVPEQHDARHAADLFAEGGVHWVTFTSSSTVTNFLALVGAERLKALGTRLASIGPSTSETLRQAGLAPTVEAKVHTIPGLVSAILDMEKGSGGNE
ncbi:MAG: uroporphyrinogen-III C-methyltransferase [Planctomycetota bacterium]|nr:uroporphyrinogen-III C-methyltransferase [Planctomycetota bacterium]